MNPHDKTIAFQELNDAARALRARVAADPLQGACVALEAAINTLNKFDMTEERNRQQERLKVDLDAALTIGKRDVEELARRKATLKGEIESLQAQVEHWKRLDQSAQIETALNNNVR